MKAWGLLRVVVLWPISGAFARTDARAARLTSSAGMLSISSPQRIAWRL
jgi:hypothetical protein